MSFLFMFILAIVPICISIYLFGRVDHAENDFLREKYRQSQQLQEVKYSEARVYSSLNDEVIAVQNQITQSQDVATARPESGNIESRINALNRSLRELQGELSGVKLNSTEALMLEMIRSQAESLEKMNSIYRDTYARLRDERDEVAKLKRRLEASGIMH